MSRHRRAAGGGIAALVVTLHLAADAAAQQAMIRPSDRPHFFAAGLGPAFYAFHRGCDPAGPLFNCRRSQFKLGLDYGYHFSGEFEGPALGLSVEQTFDAELAFFNPAAKAWWDIPLPGMAIFLTPFLKLGYVLGSDYGDTFV